MSDVVNLNRFRKKKKAAEDAAKAEENRAKFGRTKGAKQKEAAETEARDKLLDGARRDTDDET